MERVANRKGFVKFAGRPPIRPPGGNRSQSAERLAGDPGTPPKTTEFLPSNKKSCFIRRAAVRNTTVVPGPPAYGLAWKSCGGPPFFGVRNSEWEPLASVNSTT